MSYCLNVTDPFIIPFIFIFLPCHEKAHVNKEFNCENSELHCEITNYDPLSQILFRFPLTQSFQLMYNWSAQTDH